jgi:hypothetical protein
MIPRVPRLSLLHSACIARSSSPDMNFSKIDLRAQSTERSRKMGSLEHLLALPAMQRVTAGDGLKKVGVGMVGSDLGMAGLFDRQDARHLRGEIYVVLDQGNGKSAWKIAALARYPIQFRLEGPIFILWQALPMPSLMSLSNCF